MKKHLESVGLVLIGVSMVIMFFAINFLYMMAGAIIGKISLGFFN